MIEVTVVAAIIALIGAVVMPVVARSREKGRQTVCAANLRQLGQAALLYAQDSDGALPPYRNLLPGPVRDGTSDGRAGVCAPDLLVAALKPYGCAGRVTFCPSDPVAGQPVERWQVYHLHSSYKYLFRRTLELRDDGWHTKHAIISASDYPMIKDANTSRQMPPPPTGAPQDPPGGDHFHGANVCYLDGHVKWSPPLDGW